MYIKNDVSLSRANQNQSYKNRKRELNSAPKRLLKDMIIRKGNLSKDTVSFGSPVVDKSVIWKNATTSLIEKIAKFIDKFEDYGKSTVKNGGSYSTYVDSDDYRATYLGSGVSGHAYKVSVDGDAQYVIKEPKPKRCSDPIWGKGGIKHEFEMLDKYKDNSKFQQGISLMKTSDNNYYLVSAFETGQPAGRNGYSLNPLTQEGIKDTLDILDQMDKDGVFNADWNINNIFYKGDRYYPKMLDLQWAYPSYNADDYFHFVSGEKKTNFAPYEMGAVASYMSHLYDHTGSKSQARDFLRTYLMERAKHCDTSNRLEDIRKSVYENPTEDVLDAEILRLSILKNHIHQFLYTDKNNEEPRDMLKMLRYQARANFAAKQLRDFQPQRPYSQTSAAEDRYFEQMRDFGKNWYSCTNSWYRGSIDWMKKLVAKDEYQNNQTGYYYFPNQFGTDIGNSSDKTKLADLLSSGAEEQYDRSYSRVSSSVNSLEHKFVELKQAADRNSYSDKYSLKRDIDRLVSDVLI